MKDSLIIVSGGMDSITLLYDKKDEIALGVSFDYGSNHNAREIPYAAEHCRRLGIKHITINLDFIHEYFKSSLLEGAEAIPEGHYADDNMKSTVVPFRKRNYAFDSHRHSRKQRITEGPDSQSWRRPRHLSRLPPSIHRCNRQGSDRRYIQQLQSCGTLHEHIKDGHCQNRQSTRNRLFGNLELLQRRRSTLWQMRHLR